MDCLQALTKYKQIHGSHPLNTECLRYLVHICNELGKAMVFLQSPQSQVLMRHYLSTGEACMYAHFIQYVAMSHTQIAGEGNLARLHCAVHTCAVMLVCCKLPSGVDFLTQHVVVS